jgi:hypothetical protein
MRCAAHSADHARVEYGFDDNGAGMDEIATRRSRRITVRRFASASAADAHALEFWELTAADRVLQARRLSQELEGLSSYSDQVCRSVARVRRR